MTTAMTTAMTAAAAAATAATTNPAALAGWVKSHDPNTGRFFYANPMTRQTQWDPPPDWVELELPPPPLLPPPLLPLAESSASVSASSTCSNGGCGDSGAAAPAGSIRAATSHTPAASSAACSLGCCGDPGEAAAAVASNSNASSSCGADAACAVDHHHQPHGDDDDNADRDSPMGFSQLTLNEMPEEAKGSNHNTMQGQNAIVSQTTSAAARRAAVPFLASMVLPSDKRKLEKETSNLLSGHRARIMGLGFSECGQFLATAAEDSTIRVWDVATTTSNQHLLIATLLQHDDKYECTRVAWASSTWAGPNRSSLALARGGGGGAKFAIATDTTTRTGSVGYLPICAPIGDSGGARSATTGNFRGFNKNKKGSAANKNKKGATASAAAATFKYVLATGGADGVVYLWGCVDPNDDWTVVATLDHASYSHFQATRQLDDSERPQVYALQFIDHWKSLEAPSAAAVAKGDNANSARCSILMTSSDDHVHLWEVNSKTSAKKSGGCLKEVFSLRFGATQSYGNGVSVGHVTGKGAIQSTTTTSNGAAAGTTANDRVFGGTDRNPQGLVYVFDACYCPANGLLGVALSDGTLRLIHGRGICLSILQQPGIDMHLTSLAWDSSGRHLATSVASGQVFTWAIDWQEKDASLSSAATTRLRTTCRAVLEGCHERGRPLFGVQYCGTDDSLLLSWGVDGRLCL
jgi:WD40 repeat protein